MNSSVKDTIIKMGLDPIVIDHHHRNIRDFVTGKSERTFEIVDTCRSDNFAILPCVEQTNFTAQGFVSFIPAAGASSRWLTPLNKLILSFSQKSISDINLALKELVFDGILSFPIPKNLRSFIDAWVESGQIPDDFSTQDLLLDLESPKAFYPAVIEGVTFLEMKLREDDSIPGLSNTSFVCPLGRTQEFNQRLSELHRGKERAIHVYEQGHQLATVRFKPDGEMFIDENHMPSPVPAGHGALLGLISQLKSDFPGTHSAWIRNIDNVVGTSEKAVAASLNFLATHEEVLKNVQEIRRHLLSGNKTEAEKAGFVLYELWPIEGLEDKTTSVLVKISRKLFHTHLDDAASLDDILKVFSRPLVTMGQVPNTAMDVGGTAVFAKVGSTIQKLCIELPHASLKDRKKFLENPTLATHFNPVFVAVEIPSKAALSTWENHPFWLIAKKKFRGHDVFYQESILYEMLGSSAYTNLVFVEIPRLLFNPHKALPDAQRRYLRSWL